MDQTEVEINSAELRSLIRSATTTQVELCVAAQFILHHSTDFLTFEKGGGFTALQGIIRAIGDHAERLADDVESELQEGASA